MAFHRDRKLSPFSHVEPTPLLDKLYNITRPPDAPPEPEHEEAPPASAKPLIYGSGAASAERAEEPAPEAPAAKEPPVHTQPES